MSSRIATIVIDAVQPRMVADFWCDALGWHVVEVADGVVSIAPADGSLPWIDVVPVPESKTVKNRLHLDLRADGLPTGEEVERLLALGARRADVGQGADATWVVLADPEGNEFCVLPYRQEGLPVHEGRSATYGPFMTGDAFVPVGFNPPTSLATDRFRLEPLGPQHNLADHAAWMSSIEHIRSTPGYPDGGWPPLIGMTTEENLTDLRRHADDFARRAGFTFTVLDPRDDDVIGCVYVYPSPAEDWDITVQSWVRADRSDLDGPLADAVAEWLTTDWPWTRVDRCGR